MVICHLFCFLRHLFHLFHVFSFIVPQSISYFHAKYFLYLSCVKLVRFLFVIVFHFVVSIVKFLECTRRKIVKTSKEVSCIYLTGLKFLISFIFIFLGILIVTIRWSFPQFKFL